MTTLENSTVMRDIRTIARELTKIRGVLEGAFPPADTRPFAERIKETTTAMLETMSSEETAELGRRTAEMLEARRSE